eukprot:scaffold306_cov525-Prasinococcus_capsulatus_cf.AAC.62
MGAAARWVWLQRSFCTVVRTASLPLVSHRALSRSRRSRDDCRCCPPSVHRGEPFSTVCANGAPAVAALRTPTRGHLRRVYPGVTALRALFNLSRRPSSLSAAASPDPA